MKKTFLLFILYFILLSVTPCCLEDSCTEETEYNNVENCNEVCTPLLNCNTCNVVPFPQKYSKNKTYNSKLIQVIIPNLTIVQAEYFPSIWQPPKILNQLLYKNSLC